jgi:RND family efflux transporter MFP subunit
LVPASSLRLSLLAIVALGACSKDAPATANSGRSDAIPVAVETVALSKVDETGEYVGILVSRRSVTLLPRVTGYVREILVKPGEVVKAGTRLLRIDARQESAVLEQSEASLEQAKSQLELTTSTRARIEALYKEGIRSRQDFDTAVAQEQAARANVQAARANRQAQSVQVAFHEVVAPFSGVVGDVVVKVGDAVGPETVLTQVDESGQLELSVQVPLERTAGVQVGKTPMELLDGAGKVVVRAPVFFAAPRPDPRSQLVELRAALANPDRQLRSGQRVRARVVWNTIEALTVPTFAVTRQTGQAFVFVVTTNQGGATTVGRRPINLGALTGDRWTVTQGLNPGDRFAVTRIQALRDGQAVTVDEGSAADKTGTRQPDGQRRGREL